MRLGVSKSSASSTDSDHPLISAIVVSRNERIYIDRCLESVFRADFEEKMEVLVVDGMSSDGTRELLNRRLSSESRMRILNNPHRITSAGLNIGIRAALGEWIFILGAHSEYPPEYFKFCLESSIDTQAHAVGGVLTPCSENEELQSKLVHAITTHRFGVGNGGFRTGAIEGWTDTVPYGCYHRSVFKKIGVFDERLVRNQDYEFNRRLIKAGGRIWLDPRISSSYHNQTSLMGLFRQALKTGKWNPMMWHVAPYSFAGRHIIPMLFVTILLICLLGAIAGIDFGILGLSVILASYSLPALYASLCQSLRYGIGLLPLLPFTFFVYHLAYGMGEIWGLFVLLMGKGPPRRKSKALLMRPLMTERRPTIPH